MTNPRGQSYTAKVNGADAPIRQSGISSAATIHSRRPISANRRVTGVFKMKIASDAKASYDDRLQRQLPTLT
jgi:hypothetical protein